MIVNINERVYEMNDSLFKLTCDSIVEQKKDRYYIYCVVKSGYAVFVDEIFEDSKSLMSQVLKYVKQGYKVLLHNEDEK